MQRQWGSTIAAFAAVGASMAVAPARGDDFVAGSGDVKTQFLAIGPETAGLAAGVVVGETLADFQNDVARAQSRAVNMGVLGTSLTADSCTGGDPSLAKDDLPTTVRVDSREPGAEDGKTDYWPIFPRDLSYHFADLKEENGGFPNLDPPRDSPGRSNVSRLQARATKEPLAWSASDTGLVFIAGVAEVASGHTETKARIEDGKRITDGLVAIPEIRLGGGAVVLRDLEWRATQTTGSAAPADTTFDATFRMGSVTVGDVMLGWPDDANVEFQKQATALLNVINTALSPSGLVVAFPHSRQDGDHATITALEVRVERPALGRELFAMLPKEIYDARQAVFDRMIEGDCRTASAIAVGDIVAATPAGAGTTRVSFGGADAFTEGTRFADPFAFAGRATASPFVAPAGVGDDVIRTQVLGATETALPPSTNTAIAAPGSGGSSPTLAAGDVKIPGSKSGTAAVVGAIGLLAVLSVALLDYLKPRRVLADEGDA